MIDNIPCTCGHPETAHTVLNPNLSTCKFCFFGNKRCEHFYTPDNLGYVERLAKDKGLI